jgi:hypothetical protein
MGFDCTLHIVDEGLIANRFVPRLLGRSSTPAPFDQRPDAEELWTIARTALSGQPADGEKEPSSPESTGNLICMLAMAYCAAELPYHYERGLCLSLWPNGRVPRKFVGDPESLFGELVVKHPELKGQFHKEIESNCSSGIFVPAHAVPTLLKWVEGQQKRLPKSEKRYLRGLLLVLKQAAERKLSYWEGAEVPVPMEKIRPPAEQRRSDLDEAQAPLGLDLWFEGAGKDTLVFSTTKNRLQTIFVDVNVWPPRYTLINGEYTRSAAQGPKGRWVTATTTTWDPKPYYNVFVRDHPKAEPTILRAPALREVGVSWVGFLGERVVAVLNKELPKGPDGTVVKGPDGSSLGWEHELPAIPLIEENGELVPIEGLPPASERHPEWGTAHLRDGSDVFLWLGNGYELRNGRFELTFPLGAKFRHKEVSPAPFGADGFFYISEGRPYSVQRCQKRVSHLLKLSFVSYILPAGNDMYLLKESCRGMLSYEYGLKKSDSELEDLGKLYLPNEDAYIRLKPELFEDADPDEIHWLHWAQACNRLVAVTSEGFWAVPIEKVLALPRHRASTVIRVRF